jgi:acyl carrier protein
MAEKQVDKEEIFNRVVCNIVSLTQMKGVGKTSTNETTFKLETDIFDEIGIDSIEIMDLIGMLEKDFDKTFPVDKFGKRRTIGDIVNFISENLK